MKRAIRIMGIALAGVVVLILLATTAIFARAEWLMRRTYEVPTIAFEAPRDAASVAAGERLARIRGCLGCHGRDLEGGLLFEEKWVGKVIAADLTRVAATHSDAELERVIRRGVRKDGTTVWVMPSPMLYHLSDADLGVIIAFVRSRPVGQGPDSRIKLGPVGYFAISTGRFPRVAEEIDPAVPRLPAHGDDITRGRYLAMTSCSECHGPRLTGSPLAGAPNLLVARAYPLEDFIRLMREGIALGGRELGLMGQVSRGRFSHFTDDEIRALHAFLHAFDGITPFPGENGEVAGGELTH